MEWGFQITAEKILNFSRFTDCGVARYCLFIVAWRIMIFEAKFLSFQAKKKNNKRSIKA